MCDGLREAVPPRIGKAQRALDRSLDHRDAIEEFLADPWTKGYLRFSALEFLGSQLRKDRFYLFSKDQIRVFNEIVAEMKPFAGFGGLSISQLIDIAILCKSDCAFPETADFIGELAVLRPEELPLHVLWRLIAICRLRVRLPELEGVYASPPDLGDDEEKLERAEAALDRWTAPPTAQNIKALQN
jgi:hypothetical protein